MMSPGFSTCMRDNTPLICTFEKPYKEWHCLTCGAYHEFLHTNYVDETPELRAIYEDHLTRFKAGERGPLSDEGNNDDRPSNG